MRGVPRLPLRCALCIRRARLAGRVAGGARAAAARGWRRGVRLSRWRGPWHGGVNTSCFLPPLLPGSFIFIFFLSSFSLSLARSLCAKCKRGAAPLEAREGGV